MGKFVFWNALMTSKILSVSLCIGSLAMLNLYESLDCRTDQNQYLESENSHLHSGLRQSPWIISVARNYVPLGRDFINIVSKRSLDFFFPYCTNRDSFQNFLCGPFRASPMFCRVRSFLWKMNFKL